MGRYSAGSAEAFCPLGKSSVTDRRSPSGTPCAMAVVKHLASTSASGSAKRRKKRKSMPSGPELDRFITLMASRTILAVITTSTMSQYGARSVIDGAVLLRMRAQKAAVAVGSRCRVGSSRRFTPLARW
jgi:hypothetical protein